VLRFFPYSRTAGAAFIACVVFSACSSNNDTPSGDDGGIVNGTGGSTGTGGDMFPSVILDGGGIVPPPPDGAALCPAGACNYQTGEGCTGATSCEPSEATDGAVSPVCQAAGTVAAGGACSSNRVDCEPGTFCIEGTCHKLCCGAGVFGDYRVCPSGQHCLRPLAVGGANGSAILTGAYLCYPVNQCDALDPATGCASGTACQLADPTGATACIPEGTGMPGDPCPCKGGFTCVGNGCRRLCRAVADGGTPGCPQEEGVCVHFNRDPDEVGECTPR
jgi:hypothetical protein